MYKFEMLGSLSGRQAFEVLAERSEIHIIPRGIVPSMMRLHVVPVVISIDVETDTRIVLTGDGATINIEGGLIVNPMVNVIDRSKSTMVAVSSCQEVRIDIETSRKREMIVRHFVVLMSPYPQRPEWASYLFDTVFHNRK